MVSKIEITFKRFHIYMKKPQEGKQIPSGGPVEHIM